MGKFDIIKKYYIDKHLKIFPIKENAKVPLINTWQHDCSDKKMQIIYWLDKVPMCNIGLPANENNLFIIDVDVHDTNGLESFQRLCNDLNIKEPNTLKQQTPSGGIHYIFKSDDELKQLSNCANCFENYKGVDIRTAGYVVVYPSSINGNNYKFLNDTEPQEMPKELKEFVLNNVSTKTELKKSEYKKPTHVDVGDRDNQMFVYINNLYFHNRLSEEEIKVLAEHFNETVFDKPLPQSVIDYKIRKVFTKDRGECIYVKLSE